MTFTESRVGSRLEAISHYARSRQIDLARSIANRAKIYLDVRFWIIARDVAAGTETGAAAQKLLHLLRRGVCQGTLVCPISESTFIELMKQANTPTRRIGTARLIDELSLGVSITTGRSRIATEMAHFFYAASGEHNLHTMQELVWTKLSYALGDIYPSIPEIDLESELVIQRRFLDKMWDTSLSEIVATIGDDWASEGSALQNSARQINTDIKAHADDLVSYQATYRDEIIGVLDTSSDLAIDVMSGLAERLGTTLAEPGSPAGKEYARACKNLLIAAFEQRTTKNTLRTIHAQASLHAGLRWDRMTNFTANHFYDFEHAAAAVSYYDAFFTEGFLAQIANAGHIRLCDLNGCHITADLERAVEIVGGLNRSQPSEGALPRRPCRS